MRGTNPIDEVRRSSREAKGTRASFAHRTTRTGRQLLDLVALAGAAALAGLDVEGASAFVASGLLATALLLGYRPRILASVADDVTGITGAALCGAASAVVLTAADRLQTVLATCLAVVLLLATRALGHWLGRCARRQGWLRETVLLVGGAHEAHPLERAVVEHPELGLDLLRPEHGDGADLKTAIEAITSRHAVHRVILDSEVEADVLRVLRASTAAGGAGLHRIPTPLEVGGLRRKDFDWVWGVPLVRVAEIGGGRLGRLAKRGLDLAVSLFLLAALAPLMLAITVAVGATGPGGVFFRQRRIGQHGREFKILKFRTLPPNSDSDTAWSVDMQQHCGRVGRFLRRASLDELPQLLNVVRGDMSIIGPRPERPHFVHTFGDEVPGYHDRHRMPVGMTGWAQIHQLRGDTSIEDRIRFDNLYIDNWSFWLDLVIGVRTIPAVIRAARAAASVPSIATTIVETATAGVSERHAPMEPTARPTAA